MMKNMEMKTTLGCLVMAALLLAGCEKGGATAVSEKATEDKPVAVVGGVMKAANAEKGDGAYTSDQYEYYRAHLDEAREKHHECAETEYALSMQRNPPARKPKELYTGACEAAKDVLLENMKKQ